MNYNLNKQVSDNIDHEYSLTFQDYIAIGRIHIKKIIFFTLTGFVLSVYNTYNIPPKYQSTSTVEIREKPGANMVMDFSGSRSQNRMINEISVIKSPSWAMGDIILSP